jgi:hypothetical protein
MKPDKRLTLLNWLTNPQRKAKDGVELYRQYGRPGNIMRNLERSTNEKHIIEVLDNELRTLGGIDPLAVLIKPRPKQAAPKPQNKPTQAQHRAHLTSEPKKQMPPKKYTDPYEGQKKKPEPLIPVYERKTMLYVEVKQMQAHLVALGDAFQMKKPGGSEYKSIVKKREELAQKILKHWDMIDGCWQEIKYFADNSKKMPAPMDKKPNPVISVDTSDPMAMDKRYSTVRTYISKYRKDIKKNKELLTKYTTELNAIASLMNALYREERYKIYSLDTFNAQ